MVYRFAKPCECCKRPASFRFYALRSPMQVRLWACDDCHAVTLSLLRNGETNPIRFQGIGHDSSRALKFAGPRHGPLLHGEVR